MFILSNISKVVPYLVILLSLIITSCAGSTSGTGALKKLTLDPAYEYKIDKIEIVEKEKHEVDAVKMFRAALEKSLGEKGLLEDSSHKKNYYALSIKILDYDMGDAFKRWLLPGYGSTILSVHTDVIDIEKSETVAYMEHKQTISFGGFYTVGAWKYVFDTIADDIAIDLERKYSGSGEAFSIKLDPWLEHETEVPKTKIPQKIYLLPLEDERMEKNRIGERHAAFDVSMGDIYTNRAVAAYLNEALQNELLASGNGLSENNEDITLAGVVVKFWVWTDTTLLYWDVIGEIEIRLDASNSKTNKKTNRVYKVTSSSRTYIYPSKELVEGVVADTVKSLMYEIRKDSIWSKLD